jgi:hypothetical protein
MKNIERSKTGLPCMWEEGGSATNTGNAVVIVNEDGSKPKAIYIPRGGHLSCGRHALIPVRVGMWMIGVEHWRGEFEILVRKFCGFSKLDPDEILSTVEHEFSRGEWGSQPPDFIQEAIDSACRKATEYHCRCPHFVQE